MTSSIKRVSIFVVCALLSASCGLIDWKADRDARGYFYMCDDVTGGSDLSDCTVVGMLQCSETRDCTTGNSVDGEEFCHNRDYFEGCWYEKQGAAANLTYVFLGGDQQFKTSAIDGNLDAFYARDDRSFIKFGSRMQPGSSFYGKLCLNETSRWYLIPGNIVACTQVHKFTLPTNDNYEMNGRYRVLKTEVIGATISCLNEPIGGVSFCYWWEANECSISNESDTAVNFLLEVVRDENRWAAVEAMYMTPGDTKSVDCGALQAGDLLVASVWQGYFESVIDRVTDKRPDVQMKFILTSDPILEVSSRQTGQTIELPLPPTQGVECSVVKSFMVSNGPETNADRKEFSDELKCINYSADKVEVRLYALKVSEGSEDVYVRDYKLLEFNMDANDPAKDPSEIQDAFSNSGMCGVFSLDIRTEGWLGTSWGDNSNLRTVRPFTISCDSWTLAELGSSSYYEDNPD